MLLESEGQKDRLNQAGSFASCTKRVLKTLVTAEEVPWLACFRTFAVIELICVKLGTVANTAGGLCKYWRALAEP